MQFSDTGEQLDRIVAANIPPESYQWVQAKRDKIISGASAKDLYLTYSLLSGKVDISRPLKLTGKPTDLTKYLENQDANILQLSRIWLLVTVLNANGPFFIPKVANLIQLADTGELVTFLKFLVLLPEPGNYRNTAVEALRTNIATVFDAIALSNPYPSDYFNDPQWNQMFLKAAFMERDLSRILDVDRRANKDLARIISDYAHERWAASRKVDPLFWMPVTDFLDGALLDDMKVLLQSDDRYENRAGALCCFHSGKKEAMDVLEPYKDLEKKVAAKTLTWHNFKE